MDVPLTTDNGAIFSWLSKHSLLLTLTHMLSHWFVLQKKNVDLPHSCSKLKSLQPVWHYSFQEKHSAKHTLIYSSTNSHTSNHILGKARFFRHFWTRMLQTLFWTQIAFHRCGTHTHTHTHTQTRLSFRSCQSFNMIWNLFLSKIKASTVFCDCVFWVQTVIRSFCASTWWNSACCGWMLLSVCVCVGRENVIQDRYFTEAALSWAWLSATPALCVCVCFSECSASVQWRWDVNCC